MRLKSTILFIACLIVGFFIRLHYLSYPLDKNFDNSRDYLIARHIAVYHEFPLVGPPNTIFYANIDIRNSPFYYYLLAFFVRIWDDILFLGFVSILLQLVFIFCIYFLGSQLFGKVVGLIASIFVSLSKINLEQSGGAWQPYIMNPFIYISYAFLVLAYVKKSLRFEVLSVVFFVIACALHFSAFIVLPFYAFLLYLVMRSQKRKAREYLIILATALFLFSSFFITVALRIFSSKATYAQGDFPLVTLLADSFPQFYNNILHSIKTLVETVAPGIPPHLQALGFMLFLFLLLIYLLFSKRTARVFSGIIFCAILFMIVVLSLFDGKTWSHYLTPIYGLFFVLLAEVICNLPLFRKWVIFLKISLIALSIFIVSNKLTFLNDEHLREKPLSSESIKVVQSILTSIQDEIHIIQQKEKYPHLDFFYVRIFQNNQGAHSAFVWAPLEKSINKKLTQIDQSMLNDYRIMWSHPAQYHFLICENFVLAIRDDKACKDAFFRETPEYTIIKHLYSDIIFNLYLAKRKS